MVKRDLQLGDVMVNNVSVDLAALYPALKQFSSEVRKDRRLAVPPADSVTVHSRECGSQLTLDGRINDERIGEIGYKVRACSLGQASTAIVARHAVGLDRLTAERVEAQLLAILAGSAVDCEWPELEIFTLIKDVPVRHGSVLLPFDALRQLFIRAGILLAEVAEMPVPTPATTGAEEQ